MNIIIDDLSGRGLNPRRVAGTNGGEYHSPCPACGGRDRFHVWPDQGEAGTWWCRGCDRGGDAIQYLMDFCGKDFKAAAATVGRDVTDVPRTPATPRRRQKPAFTPAQHQAPMEMWQAKAAAFVDWAHKHLIDNPEQLRYLASRGIPEAAVQRYRLGYNPGENDRNAIYRARKAWGLPEEMKGGRQRPLWIPRGIVIPLIKDGAVHRIRIRREKADLTPQSNLPYFVLPGSSAATMVLGEDTRAVVVIEAELDAIACVAAAGDIVSAAAVGSSSTKPDEPAAAAMKQALCILNALDFDAAGTKAWKWWKSEFPRAKRWPVPEGKDPGEAVARGVNLRAWILAGLPPVFRMTGSTRLDGDDRNPEAEKESDPDEREKETGPIPGNILAVADLFERYPVKIVKDARRLRFVEDRAWAAGNPDMSRRINLAVFFDRAVFEYISHHPSRVIDATNFMEPLS